MGAGSQAECLAKAHECCGSGLSALKADPQCGKSALPRIGAAVSMQRAADACPAGPV
jgi:hypothetical protein